MSECDVCIGGFDGDGEYFEFYTTKLVKARKQHICDECDLPIVPGRQYHRSVGKYEGSMDTFTECLLCWEIRVVFSCGEGWQHGGILWADMRDIVFPKLTLSSPCFRELSIPAKNFVLERWKVWKGLNRVRQD